ncbi:MAG: hypothetical protein U1E56_13790 [Bauldia sp.]
MQILKTDGGPHPADVWAAATAKQIVDLLQIDPASASPAAVAARKAVRPFETRIIEILEGAHDAIQKTERAALAGDAGARLAAAGTPEIDSIEEAVAAIVAAAAGTPFSAHFAGAPMQEFLARHLAIHFSTSIDVERQWHAHNNPDDPACAAWRATRTEAGPELAHHCVAAAIPSRPDGLGAGRAAASARKPQPPGGPHRASP